jgi:activator-of-BECN1-regulated-autophagy protein 1
LRVFGENYSVTKYHSSFLKHLGGEDQVDETGARPASSDAVSTISIAFSEDSQTMASTHGDHTVKITCCSTGRLLQTLEGHPRTPWTVKFHPLKTNIVASGCLGFQVRVWDWKRPACLHMLRLDYAIISLSFHPSGHILAVASGSRMHFWDYNNHGNRTDTNGATTNGAITEVEQRSMLRCVHFPPDGNSIIVGGMNPNQDESRRNSRGRGGMSGGGISFYLRLWDFDLDSALHPEPAADDPRLPRGAVRLHRKPLANVSVRLVLDVGSD